MGLPKFGWFDNLEEVASELKAKLLGEAELATQGDVPLRGTEAAEGVASKITLRRGGNPFRAAPLSCGHH